MNITNVSNQNQSLFLQEPQETLSMPIATLIPPAIAVPVATREIIQKQEDCCPSCIGWNLFFHYVVRYRYHPYYS